MQMQQIHRSGESGFPPTHRPLPHSEEGAADTVLSQNTWFCRAVLQVLPQQAWGGSRPTGWCQTAALLPPTEPEPVLSSCTETLLDRYSTGWKKEQLWPFNCRNHQVPAGIHEQHQLLGIKTRWAKKNMKIWNCSSCRIKTSRINKSFFISCCADLFIFMEYLKERNHLMRENCCKQTLTLKVKQNIQSWEKGSTSFCSRVSGPHLKGLDPVLKWSKSKTNMKMFSVRLLLSHGPGGTLVHF